MRVSDFDYALPEELIAQHPDPARSGARMLHLDAARGTLEDRRIVDLPACLAPHDLLVVNDTRVIKARLAGSKASGGRVELFVERIESDEEALCLMRVSHPPKPGSLLELDGGVQAEVRAREGERWRIGFPGQSVSGVLERIGSVPLPPYIQRPAGAEDEARYQTVFAARPGAVAAPTAGLHFDAALLARIGARVARVTLHVGFGTFGPVRSDTVEAHRMHSERYAVPQETVDAIARARAAGGRVLAVGTTALRALESAAAEGSLRACEGETDLFVYPGFRFRVVDRLLTNFHLPRSSLLMLVSAFAGAQAIRRAYAHAIAARYRFFSYGDAMLIERAAA
ncbi:MAG TPA: tRNA preQ1(34) S-adenosylmethionine ribosyltransferase-isomerase QueA [Burkholderiales bacterium]